MRAMLLLSVLTIAAPVRPQRESVPEEMPLLAEQILGEWVTVQYTRGGTVDKEAEGTGIKFTRNELEINEKRLGMKIVATYQLDAAKSPARIDLVVAERPNLKVRAIFKVEGNLLTLCLSDGGDDLRPTSFASPPGTSISVIALRRAPAK